LQLLFPDQLGSHFDLGEKMLLPEVLSQFKKRPYHRQKAHLILYAIRSRAMDPRVELVSLRNYRDLGQYKELSVAVRPTTRPMAALAESLELQQMPTRGFCSSEDEWRQYSTGKKLKLEDFYRQSRRRLGVLMDGDSPLGGAWNFDAENRLPPPKEPLAVEPAWTPVEDELDDAVRQTLDELEREGVRFIGVDGPRRFAATEAEARTALEHFIENRLDLFGPYEDAMDQRDWTLSHSLLSVPMNLGLLDPIDVVRMAEQAYKDGKARLSSVEGFIRQILGWRDYVFHLYWHFDEDYTAANHLDADSPLPEWMRELDPDAIQAKCLSVAISSVRNYGWAHHIHRLMVLGNHSLQRGYNPSATNDWFIDAFVDGTPWVMPANVIGMTLYADGGAMSTKPYAAGGAYINRMSNYCSGCSFDPKKRLGDDACPFTAGYWDFISKNEEKLRGNFRMSNALSSLRKLRDIDEVVRQENARDKF
jgi:deoxyribodipyrimidine photolyase-related protein